MTARWHYHDVVLEIDAALIHKGRRYAVPMYGGETLEHAMSKVCIATHLLVWGYSWHDIHWEKLPPRAPSEYRPDLYASGTGSLPRFWFECVATDQPKLAALTTALPQYRIVRVVSLQWFEQAWNGGSSAVIDGRLVALDKVRDWRDRRKYMLSRRQSIIPPGAECWAIRGMEDSPRITFAVRREPDGSFTYLDTGEGWSLSRFRYIPSSKDRFRALIPGVVGSESWRGRSQAYREEAPQPCPAR